MLANIGPILRKVAYGENLTAEEARQALNVIGDDDFITDSQQSDGLYFLALTFGMMAKGPTAEELLGFVHSLGDKSVHFSTKLDPSQITDVSGTGGDQIKTFNVGTTASFVIAAGGICVAKQATRSYTGLTGSADVFRAVGLDPNTIEPNQVSRCLEEVGIVAFYTPAFSRGFKNRIDFLTKLKNIGLIYPTPWHLISWVYSPFAMKTRLYGVFSDRYLTSIAKIFQNLGCERGMVLHGLDGLDELSNIGDTKIAEFNGAQPLREFTIAPEELGVQRATAGDIRSLNEDEESALNSQNTNQETRELLLKEGRERNLNTFFRVLYGKDKGPKRDIVLINAGASLYLAGKTRTLSEGTELARSLVEDGSARKKVEQLAAFFHSQKELDNSLRKARI